MPTSPGFARRASTPGGMVAMLVAVVALGACAGSSGSTSSASTTAAATSRTSVTGPFSLPPATIPAGGCTAAPPGASATVTVTVDESGFSPRCVTVTETQTLRLRNAGRTFHNVVVEDLDANLAAGDEQVWDDLGQYLPAGTYLLYSGTERSATLYPGFHATLVVAAR